MSRLVYHGGLSYFDGLHGKHAGPLFLQSPKREIPNTNRGIFFHHRQCVRHRNPRCHSVNGAMLGRLSRSTPNPRLLLSSRRDAEDCCDRYTIPSHTLDRSLWPTAVYHFLGYGKRPFSTTRAGFLCYRTTARRGGFLVGRKGYPPRVFSFINTVRKVLFDASHLIFYIETGFIVQRGSPSIVESTFLKTNPVRPACVAAKTTSLRTKNPVQCSTSNMNGISTPARKTK